jgi:UDP-N-acetylmuramoyl-L-alanyl-D-glutamate--2,6-diaminopimelate ligase
MSVATQTQATHSIRKLLHRIALIPGKMDRPITGLADDSRQVRDGDLFIALAGHHTHGADHLEQAIDNGAAAALVEIEGPVVRHTLKYGPPVIGVPSLSLEVGTIASRFHGDPSQQMEVIGITGTNGKTSIAQMLAHALDGLPSATRRSQGDDTAGQARCGVIGTLGWGLYGDLQATTHTTPGALQLQTMLADLLHRDATRVVMEVSSHALDQYRADGVAFKLALFTNLSHEHLDYHGDLGSYGRVKRRLFMFPGLQWAVINSDDEFGRKLFADPPGTAEMISYGLEHEYRPMVSASNLDFSDGLSMDLFTPWGNTKLHSPLLGRFNASNLLAAVTALGCLGIPLQEAVSRLSGVGQIDGRMQAVSAGADEPLVVVDYAHTPDALQQALQALREHTRGHLWCVFGCGGDRDREKRAVMGDIAERFADQVVVTWDNPRSEEPGYIIGQILGGMDQPTAVHVDRDRGAAIDFAIREAAPADTVLIAGKGHEDYQIIGDQRLHFSDRETAATALEARHG